MFLHLVVLSVALGTVFLWQVSESHDQDLQRSMLLIALVGRTESALVAATQSSWAMARKHNSILVGIGRFGW
jgi:hypothetical protein